MVSLQPKELRGCSAAWCDSNLLMEDPGLVVSLAREDSEISFPTLSQYWIPPVNSSDAGDMIRKRGQM